MKAIKKIKNYSIGLAMLFTTACATMPSDDLSDTGGDTSTESRTAKQKPVMINEEPQNDLTLGEPVKKVAPAEVVKASVAGAKNSMSRLPLLGLAEYKKGNYDAAESYMLKAIKEQPTKSELYHNLGLIYLAKNEQRQAVLTLRKGLQINSKDPAIAAQLGAIFTKAKDFTKAEVALEIAVDNGTPDQSTLNNYAIALTANKKTDEASRIYEKMMKSNPSSRDIMLNYSIFLIEQKQKYKQGLDLLNRLKFVGVQPEARNIIKELENRAKAGLK